MPELPEVEVVRRGLTSALTDRTIVGAHVDHDRLTRRHLSGPDDFVSRLIGERCSQPRRRGKYLWVPLASGDALVAHLGMSGQFRVDDQDRQAPSHRHARVWFELDDGRRLTYCDQRMFGWLLLSEGGAELPSEISHIGLDPFDPSYQINEVVRRVRARKSGIKRALLDQTLVSGIGNIYADESLWRARLHPERACDSLSRAKVVEVLTHAHAVMADALDQGGTSFDSLYVNVNGESGYFSRELDAYGREGLPCKRCGTPMVRQQFMNRSSTFCPRCQRIK